jgi:hypothetical protein
MGQGSGGGEPPEFRGSGQSPGDGPTANHAAWLHVYRRRRDTVGQSATGRIQVPPGILENDHSQEQNPGVTPENAVSAVARPGGLTPENAAQLAMAAQLDACSWRNCL